MRYVQTGLFLTFLLTATGCGANNEAHTYSGTIEGTEIIIQSELGGVLQSMALEEGDHVEKEQTTAELAVEEYSLHIAEAQAAVHAAQANLDEARAGNRSEKIREAAAKVEQAQALNKQAQAKTRVTEAQIGILEANKTQLTGKLDGALQTLSYQQDRLQKAEVLRQSGAIPEQEINTLREVVNQAQTSVGDIEKQISTLDAQITQVLEELSSSNASQASSEANTKAAQANLEWLQAGNTDYTLSHMLAQKELAESKLALANLQLNKTLIRSPEAGTILRKHVHSGEVIKPGATLYTLLKQGELEVVVYVPVTALNQVQIGQKTDVFVDAYPEHTFSGTVTRIASQAEFTPKNVQIPDERTKMVFAVSIALTDGENELKPGMPADITFTPLEEAGERP